MFLGPLTQANRALSNLRASLQLNEGLRRGLAAGTISLPAELLPLPDLPQWRIADHCGAVTRLYTIFEGFVHELISEWLTILGDHTAYADLSPRTTRAHRAGIGRILENFDGRRFKDLSLLAIVTDFGRAIANERRYSLLADALLLHDRNLRLDVLTEVLGDCGLTIDLADWLRDHPRIKANFQLSPLDKNVSKILDDLVDFRNDAAHAGGGIDTIIGERSLVAYFDFFDAFNTAMYQAFCAAGLEIKVAHGEWNKIGQVNMVKRDDKTICVVIMRGGTIRIGDELFFRSKTCCFPTRVLSIQQDNVPRDMISSLEDREVGLKLDVELPNKGLSMYSRIDTRALPVAV